MWILIFDFRDENGLMKYQGGSKFVADSIYFNHLKRHLWEETKSNILPGFILRKDF